MRHTIRTLAVLAAAGTIAGTVAMTGPAEAAEAATAGSCPPISVANVDPGYGVMKGRFNLKVGPYAGRRCAIVTSVGRGTVLYFHCWTKNRYGTLWVFARVKGTGTTGWMSIDNFSYYDTPLVRCP
ncbi:hypothetical protein ACFFV7_10270 [Nonomuraea spiralis]|uniref:SH3 domain-containing protein n=1 Tax=Nonomuraea spiralis TaxID=46182 RepID=A0ABV5IAL7_9ACTN|nr:hypothetical protein [Nonomuraea spiralis]GGT03853.1 hypothetical protein GCM10010176_055030 [Nonomuraea spiralis]